MTTSIDINTLIEMWNQAQQQMPPQQTPQYRVYYDADGGVVFYASTAIDSEHKWIGITVEQYQLARPDAVVRDSELHYTHLATSTYKLERCSADDSGCVAVSCDDITILITSSQISSSLIHWYRMVEHDAA